MTNEEATQKVAELIKAAQDMIDQATTIAKENNLNFTLNFSDGGEVNYNGTYESFDQDGAWYDSNCW